MERLSRLFNMKDTVGQNPTKEPMVHKGSEVSTGTQPEEEECTGIILENIGMIRCLDNKGISISKTKDQKQSL